MDDLHVDPDPLWSQVLHGDGLQLEGVLLEVFEANLEEDFIRSINFLYPVLSKIC